MASQVEICNRALFKLGASPITSVSDNSKAARTMGSLWDTVRRAELSGRYWAFAITRAQLPAVDPAPAWQFANAYQLPPDFLKLVQVSDVFAAPGLQDYRYYDDSPWSVESGQILTDFEAPLKIRYVRDVEDTGAFDALFTEVMASKLAYEACYAITQSREGQNVAMQDYTRSIRAASVSNAILKPPQGLPDDSWILGRV